MITTAATSISQWSMLVDPLLGMLIDECKDDHYLAEAMRRSDKNMESCAEYIYKTIQSMKQGQKCVCLPDQEVIKLAKEYFLK